MRRKLFLTIGVLIAIAALITVTQAQTITGVQQWEYALMVLDTTDNSFTYNSSVLYESAGFDFITTHEAVETMYKAMGREANAAPVDYLAIMGLNGYELVDVTTVGTPTFIIALHRSNIAEDLTGWERNTSPSRFKQGLSANRKGVCLSRQLA